MADYSAVCPELPGCASAGETEEEAKANSREAIELYLSPGDIDVPENARVIEVTVERRTPRLTSDQVILVGVSGSHQKWRHPTTGKQVIVAHHRGRVLLLGTMRAIIAASGVPLSEWLN